MAEKKKKGTGFAAPVYGTVHPKGSTVKKLPNGRVVIEPPKKKK